MHLSPDFIKREVAGETILIPVGSAASNFSGLIALNESGKFLYEELESGRTEEELVDAMLETYQVDHDTAVADVTEFLTLLRKHQILADDKE